MGTRLFAVTEDGCAYPIVATAEKLEGRCGIDNGDNDVKRLDDSTFSFDHDNNGTDVDWDSQVTKTNDNGEEIFLDEDGDEWPASSLQLLVVDEDGDPITDEDGDLILEDETAVVTAVASPDDDEDVSYAGSVRRL
jgi:hypothetical protein